MIDCYLVELGYWKNYNEKEFKRYIYAPDNISKALFRERYGFVGIFKTVYSYDRRDIDNAYLLGDFYLDFDDEDNFENVREDALLAISLLVKVFRLYEDDIDIYFSGNKGIHLVLDKKILGIEPNKKLNFIFKYIMTKIRNQTKKKTIDTVIYDSKRLFRIPNSKHEKTNLFKIPITYNELKNYSLDQIKSLAQYPRELIKPNKKLNEIANKMYCIYVNEAEREYQRLINMDYQSNVDKKIRDIPPCIQHLLDVGPIDGNKNNSLAALVSFYKTQGYSYKETKEKLLEWNENLIPKGEFNRTCNSIYTKKFKYGCSTLKNISVCDYKSCPLMRGKKRKGVS